MNTGNSQRNSVRYGRTKCKLWTEKSPLERKLVISLIVVVLLFIGFLLFIIIKHSVTVPKICHTPGCLSAASQIVSHIDPSADPCNDFFKFACGKFIEDSHGDIKASSIVKLGEEVQRQLTEIIKEPIKDDENYWIKSQKALFQACMNETAVEEESLNVFEETLIDLHGWPVVVGYQWNEGLFDWKEIIYKLRNKGYFFAMMLAVGIMPDPGRKNRHIVTVSVPYVEKINTEHKQLYLKYMIDVAVIFGAERSRAVNEMERVLDFMENLRKIDETNENNTDTKANETAALLATRYRVEEYQNMNGDIDWLDYINRILYPVGNISKDDYVLFPKIEITEAFFNLIYRTNKRILGNYIIWIVIQNIMQYMSKELKQCETNYKCLTNDASLEKTRLKYCSKVVKRSFHPPPLEIMYARKYLPVQHRNKVSEMVERLQSEFITVLHDTSWMDEETRSKSLEKAKSVLKVIGAPGDYFHDSIFDHYANNTSLQKDESFFRMLLYYRKILRDSYYFKIHMNVNDTKMEEFYSFITSVDAMYSFEDNVMMLPVGILQGVFYNPDRPMYLNYGAIGAIIGHELTHAFGELGSKHDKNGYEADMWTNKTREAYREKTKCLVEEADEYEINDAETTMNGTLTLEENVADYTGLKLAYAAYNKWVNHHGQELLLPEIKYSPSQLFWISAVSYECFTISSGTGRTKKDILHAHNSFRVIAPLRNNPDFSRDFSCPVGSKMNPPIKCQVF